MADLGPRVQRDRHLVGVLRRGRHDREFRTWGNVFLFVSPLFMTPHLIVFGLAMTAPRYTREALSVTWLVIMAILGFLFWVNRTRLRLPSSPVVRNYASLLVGCAIAASLLPTVSGALGLTPRARTP